MRGGVQQTGWLRRADETSRCTVRRCLHTANMTAPDHSFLVWNNKERDEGSEIMAQCSQPVNKGYVLDKVYCQNLQRLMGELEKLHRGSASWSNTCRRRRLRVQNHHTHHYLQWCSVANDITDLPWAGLDSETHMQYAQSDVINFLVCKEVRLTWIIWEKGKKEGRRTEDGGRCTPGNKFCQILYQKNPMETSWGGKKWLLFAWPFVRTHLLFVFAFEMLSGLKILKPGF